MADGRVEWTQWMRHYLQIVQKKGIKGAEEEAAADPSLPQYKKLSIIECLHDMQEVLVTLGEERAAVVEAAMDFAGPVLGEPGCAPGSKSTAPRPHFKRKGHERWVARNQARALDPTATAVRPAAAPDFVGGKTRENGNSAKSGRILGNLPGGGGCGPRCRARK